LLPNRAKVAAVKHHAALPFGEVRAFVKRVRQHSGSAARALEFTILTAARTSEVLLARWEEFNLPGRLWVIPASRMKAGKEHRVPLSLAALAVLEHAKREQRGGDYIFPGARDGAPLSNMSMLSLLRRMGRADLTVHGFRSTFRDWAAEATSFSHELAEMALAHAIGNRVEAAYRRGDMFVKRLEMMDAWGEYCDNETPRVAEIVVLRKSA
jgi:integrase